LPVIAWQYFSFTAPDAVDRRLYVADLTNRESGVEAVVWKRVLFIIPQIRFYLSDHVPWVVAVPLIRGTVVDNALWVVALVTLGASGLYALIRKWMLAALFFVAYGGLMLAWPYSFERLVRPILPVILVALLSGVGVIAARLTKRHLRWPTFALATLLAVGAILRLTRELAPRLACDRRAPAESLPCWPEDEREFLQLTHWIRDSTPDDAVFFVSKERAFYVHSGRKSINQDRGLREDSTALGGYLRSRGVDYTVVTAIGVFARKHAASIASACREFRLVKQVSPRTMLLRVLPEPDPSDSTVTCTTVRQYVQAEYGVPSRTGDR
jgi:hypothetical protein